MRDSKENADSLAVPAGLVYQEWGCWGDRYLGRAEDLIAAGLITADQLPGLPGTNKFSRTFYGGAPVKKGSNHNRDERYLSIKRQGKKFEVVNGVSEQVEEQRRAARHAQRESDAAAEYQEEKREAASKKTPEDFLEACASSTDYMRMYLDGAMGAYPFKFSAEARAKMEAIMGQLEALMRSSEVQPLHPEKTSAGKAHLRLAWSAS